MVRKSSNNLSLLGLGVLAAGVFVVGVDGLVLAGLLPQVARDLDVSVAQAGQLTTVFAATYAVAHVGQIMRSGHTAGRKAGLLAETLYNVINLVASWFGIVSVCRL